MSGDSEAKAKWVHRVLGVTVAVPSGAGPQRDGDAVLARVRAVWRQASEAVHGQIAALQATLGKSGDDDLEEISDYGLKDLTEGREAKLVAALDAARGADLASMPAGRSPLIGEIDGFASFVASSQAIEVCDDNPFGVAVSIRRTLGAAFDSMRSALAGGAASS